jgi:hypothetical protein
MLLSYWRSYSQTGRRVICAVVLAVALAVLVAVPHFYGGPSGEPPNRNGESQLHKKHWQPHFSPAEPYAAYQNSDCQSPKDREEADLCQQWRVAEATEKAVTLAESQFWWNILQAASTVLAAIATALAARAAAAAASSAERSVKHAEGVSQSELRPYVFCEKFITNRGVSRNDPETTTHMLLELQWRNYGHTPARNIVINLNHGVFDQEDEPEVADFPDAPNQADARYTLGPTQVCYARRVVPFADVVVAHNENKNLIYWGWIEYSGLDPDVRHRTEICAGLIPDSNPTPDTFPTFRNFYVSKFNAADADCVHKPKTSDQSGTPVEPSET